MSDILCLYYSRTGKTKQAMEEIALALDAEIVGIQDEINRSGTMGFIMSGLQSELNCKKGSFGKLVKIFAYLIGKTVGACGYCKPHGIFQSERRLVFFFENIKRRVGVGISLKIWYVQGICPFFLRSLLHNFKLTGYRKRASCSKITAAAC